MITEIVAHGNPVHLDELVGKLMLQRHGEEKLPGVSTATFRYLLSEDNVETLAAQRENVVLLGLGAEFRNESNKHRIFDEHVANGDKSQRDECAATLVAKFLGLDQELRWKKILRYVLHTDKNPPNLTLDLSATVIRLQQLQGWGLHAVLLYTEMAVDAALKEAEQFTAVSLLPMREEELLLNGERNWITVIEGDDPNAPKFARFLGAAVVVVKNPNGQVQILTTNHLRLDMRDVIRALRLREQWIRGGAKITDWRWLEQEGTIEEVLEWFFHAEAGNILNGGKSRPDIPPTKIPLEMIVTTVKMCLETSRFEHSREARCNAGTCTSTLRNPCPWYRLGLLRCRTTRAKAYQATTPQTPSQPSQ